MELRPGMRLHSAVCATEVVVVHVPSTSIDLRCGGHPMVPAGGEVSSDLALLDRSGTLLGKRYIDESTGVELLCTKAGDGGLSIDGHPVHQKLAKALPSSD